MYVCLQKRRTSFIFSLCHTNDYPLLQVYFFAQIKETPSSTVEITFSALFPTFSVLMVSSLSVNERFMF
jgi:hypothetical protein